MIHILQAKSIMERPFAIIPILLLLASLAHSLPHHKKSVIRRPDIVFRDKPMFRNGIKDLNRRWPNSTIPYIIDSYFDENTQRLIREAMNEFHKHTCIRFKPRTMADKDYINIITDGQYCLSEVGRIGGRQDLILSVGCETFKGVIMHELMHAVGFYHEQSRFDRDKYVIILEDNIISEYKDDFYPLEESQSNDFGVDYDYYSIMHYQAYDASKYGVSPTIMSVNGSLDVVQDTKDVQLHVKSLFPGNTFDIIV